MLLRTPQATVQREDGSFVDEARWPAAGVKNTKLNLSKPLNANTGGLSIAAATSDPVSFSGTGKVSVRVQVNKVAAGIKARLVDYGTANRYTSVSNIPNTSKCWGDGNTLDIGCYAETQLNTAVSDTSVVVRTLADVGHYKSLDRKESLQSGMWYDLSFELNADDVVFAAGHRLGLVLTVELDNPSIPFTGATITMVRPIHR
ncbi:CocE/NonD family hydrolase C-terminal non-catalytic domain-containing protein [Kribbella sp. VKM Ac-2568]|uniref:CocE/NonD family hydrolase C-terminal non-catalytic domain-containing protein n=1 Tax=Kribbella sp. VKM Ac-2568 TaxID=2512219 RepID=UPI0010ED325E|nr:CocE/NonD family hydrolase C-terminal non-catalytic domain-containing protein [Kribbella sp. VKM Ac-2568]TCM49229.1 X-Pro dipeptidyl-peptidase-like protein [Kribbella sp. VKM Ac-2568]